MNPEQCIINEYTKNQGIAAHIDARTFGPIVVSISFLEPCNMILTKGDQRISLQLAPRSMLILSGEARTSWKHEIEPVSEVYLTDCSVYQKPDNYRRLSLTYRTIALNFNTTSRVKILVLASTISHNRRANVSYDSS